jgi:methionyl-tRNA formyltransferase
VTNPDRPAGRGMHTAASPVKEVATARGLKVLQPASARDPALHEEVRALSVDAAVVVAYGKLLPLSLLEIPPLGFVNLHFSLLPKFRGAAPVERAVIDGVRETGVSTIVLTEGMDEGPVLSSQVVSVGSDETAGELGDRLATIGAPLLVKTLEQYASGELVPTRQNHDAATYAPKLTSTDARIDWFAPAASIHNLVRGLNPAPGAWTQLRDGRLKVWGVRVIDRPGLESGELVSGDDLIAGCGDGAVVLVDVQMAGRSRMTGGELARGLRLAPGEKLE